MAFLNCHMKGYIQPFERQLAIAELRALSGAEPEAVPSSGSENLYKVNTTVDAGRLLSKLAYWQSIGAGEQEFTRQVRAEATSAIARNGVLLADMPTLAPSVVDSKVPNKRTLRYASHGLHEYRGKFFPQLVRSLMNMAEVPENGIVLDPMCGSGTTLVEATLAGRASYGLDMNPLSVFLSTVKCQVLGLRPAELIDAHNQVVSALKQPVPKLGQNSYFAGLPDRDQRYLEAWIAPSVLEELDHIELTLRRLNKVSLQNLFGLSLSNIIRGVSWQKPEDLRVRKEVIHIPLGETIARFLDEATRAVKSLVAFSAVRGEGPLGRYVVQEADARLAAQALPELGSRVDCVITSPPYATALPYLDTDRLSLIYLGLLPRVEHRAKDVQMIGNREVTTRVRGAYWSTFEERHDQLPASTQELIRKVDRLNTDADVGFRRRNLSALLAKYFFDMRDVIAAQHDLLRSGGTMFMVIGNNRTNAGGEDVEIRTTDHLAAIAQELGFQMAGNLSMEMLKSRDIFQKNAMPSEQIITLRKN